MFVDRDREAGIHAFEETVEDHGQVLLYPVDQVQEVLVCVPLGDDPVEDLPGHQGASPSVEGFKEWL